MTATATQPVLDPATQAACAQHKVMHDIGLCTCPCMAALLYVMEMLPRIVNGARIEGVLAAVSTNEEDTE